MLQTSRLEVPRYLSMESEKRTWEGLIHEFDLFTELDYDRFKIVSQRKAHHQRSADFTFRKGASGMFGEDAPGEWMTRDQAVRAYGRIFLNYRVAGDFSPLRSNRADGPLQIVKSTEMA